MGKNFIPMKKITLQQVSCKDMYDSWTGRDKEEEEEMEKRKGQNDEKS